MTPLGSTVDIAENLMQGPRSVVARQIEGLNNFAGVLMAMPAAIRASNRRALNAAAKIIKTDARAQIGEYQEAVGNYPAWEQLADSTEDEKARLGAPADAPLERFGDLKKSFRSTLVSSEEVIIGSTDPVMTYHELGTSKMPPRPVLGPALLKHIEEIRKLVGYSTLEAFVVGQHLGYRFSEDDGI
jgi:HK97 gp10 family phage protein